jgi:hypothetical protein
MNHTHGSAPHAHQHRSAWRDAQPLPKLCGRIDSPRANMTEQGRRFDDRELAVILCLATELTARSAATVPGVAPCAGPAGQVRDGNARPETDQA